MQPSTFPARIHLLPAKTAPIVIVIRRKPSKLFHVLKWDTDLDELQAGSWFHGKLYPMRCDVSPDGRHMVYLAMGSGGHTWNGVCEPPFLRTMAEGENMGTWSGGGYFASDERLLVNSWSPSKGDLPFRCEPLQGEHGGEDLSVLVPRLERDGWRRRGLEWGREVERVGTSKLTVDQIGDDGWAWRPSKGVPELRMRFLGYLEHGYTFGFELEGHSGLLDGVDWACYDSRGRLVYTQAGSLYLWGPEDLDRGEPRSVHDLEGLESPPR
jgi:hypothetical protein